MTKATKSLKSTKVKPTKEGKTGDKAAKPKKKVITFKAPADFKPHFLLVQLTTEKDGLVGTDIKATRYQGRFDREAEDKKKFDLGSYDQKTLLGIAARLSAVTYKANSEKRYDADIKARKNHKGSARLPASTIFQLLLRINRKSKDGTLSIGVKGIWQGVVKPNGRTALRELEKTDVCYRALRKANRILPAAFKDVQMPPKRTRGKQVEE